MKSILGDEHEAVDAPAPQCGGSPLDVHIEGGLHSAHDGVLRIGKGVQRVCIVVIGQTDGLPDALGTEHLGIHHALIGLLGKSALDQVG